MCFASRAPSVDFRRREDPPERCGVAIILVAAEFAHQVCTDLSELLRRQALQELSDQRDFRAMVFVFAQQIGKLQAQRGRDLTQQQHEILPCPPSSCAR
jgi:hypothetical protein